MSLHHLRSHIAQVCVCKAAVQLHNLPEMPVAGSVTPAPERFELPASSVCAYFDVVFSHIAYYFTHLGDNNDEVG
jgi:hypothetical protein